MVKPLLEAGVNKRVIDVFDPHHIYAYSGIGEIIPEPLAHNVPNCGYHIFTFSLERLFYATDTGTLDGIEAKCYDLYMIEANHAKKELEARRDAKIVAGEFSYEVEAERNHLSREQAEDWLYQQIGPNSKYVFLHQHVDRSVRNENQQ